MLMRGLQVRCQPKQRGQIKEIAGGLACDAQKLTCAYCTEAYPLEHML